MHGRVKVRTTAEQEAIKNAERAKKVQEYKAAMNMIFTKKKEGKWDQELLSIVGNVLMKNADVTTLWNIRREVIETIDHKTDEYISLLKSELSLIEHCLKENPKSYGAWHHRCWVIDHLPEPNWETELALCAECLSKDERNFHCWNYRDFIVRKAKIPDEEEFEFSTTKILNNFSNYSSWHYRSRILSKMFPDNNNKLPIREDKHKEELDLAMDAIFTDPNDSSVWFYQRWLLSCQTSLPTKVWRIQITKDNGTIVFHKDTCIDSSKLSLFINGELINCEWKAVSSKKFSKLWFMEFPKDLNTIQSNDNLSITFEGDTFTLKKCDSSEIWLYKSIQFSQNHYNESQLKRQLENYNQLFEMEPNNKWALLTIAILKKNINFTEFYASILDHLNSLMKLDTLHSNYYKDLRSKYIIEYNLSTVLKQENEKEQTAISMTSLDLTTIYYEQYFSFFEEVNFGANYLSQSLHLLYTLQNCTKLSLSSNGITSVKHFPILRKLKILSLRNNDINNVDEIIQLIKQHNLKQLDVRDNPVCQELVPYVASFSAHLEILLD